MLQAYDGSVRRVGAFLGRAPKKRVNLSADLVIPQRASGLGA
jgi:hypothetical protein